MGFKSKSKETSQSNICNPFKVGGLIFDSEYDYQLFKDIDRNLRLTVELVKDGIIDINEFFNKVKKINVRECYYEAAEEIDGLFVNAIQLLCYRGTIFDIEGKAGLLFYDKINFIKYHSDSDSDNESD